MAFQPIVATLGYIMSPDGRRVLMIHRNKRPDDLHYGKYNGLGGRLEPGESVVECMRREIREESGLLVEQMALRGTLEWVPVESMLDLPLWESDRLFLPIVFDRNRSTFHGVMPYQDGRMVSWS